MAYTPPGVTVRTELTDPGVVIQSADQDPVLVGELFEVFEDQAAVAKYDATTGAGAQVIAWPAKKLTSIVDLAGVRKDTAEPDSQLREGAPYPLVAKLQDPSTLTKITLNPLTDIEAVGQAGFTLVEGVAAAVARTTGSNASAAESNKIRRRIGGFVTNGVKIGDKLRVVLAHPAGGVTTLRGTVTSVSDLEIGYSTSGSPVVDDPTLVPVDGDAATTPGRIISAAGGFTAGLTVGDRVAIWTEAAEVDDGNGTVASTITSATGLGLTSADVGRKVTLGSVTGAVTNTDGATNGTNTFTGTGITSAAKGRVVRISGGTASIPATYRRVVTAGAGTLTFSGATIAASTGCNFTVYVPVVRKIATVVAAGEFTYSGADISAGGQTGIPVILHTKVLRDVTVVNNDTDFSYSGTAVTSVTGFLLNLPVDVYKADVQYQVFPDYSVLVSYRALDVTLIAGKRVAKAADLTPLGGTGEYNPLLFAAKWALTAMGTTNRNLLLVAVNPWQHQVTATGFPEDRDDVAAYNKALGVLSNDPAAYSLAPLTKTAAIRDAFSAHALAMSLPANKRERGVYLAYNLPMGKVESTTGGIEPGLDGGNKKILDTGKNFVTTHAITPGLAVVVTKPAAFAGTYEVDGATTDNELVLAGANWTQTEEFAVANGNFDAVSGQVTSATTGVWKDVDVGDWIKSGVNYRRVTAKVNNQTLSYAGVALTGTGQAVSVIRSSLPPNEAVEYYVKPLSLVEQAAQLKAISQARAFYRAVHVWPDKVELVTGTDAQGNDVKKMMDSVYLAAMACARDAVLRPERSSTGMALNGPSGLLHSNEFFEDEHLNTIAEGGWTVFVQPTPGGNIETRHLLSTDRSSIKRQEFSVTKNVDNQAKVIRASLKPSLNDDQGRKNITKPFLDSLMLPFQGVLKFFVSKDQLVVGPNGEAPYTIVSITQDPVQQDQILAVAKTTQPVPANTLDVTYVI